MKLLIPALTALALLSCATSKKPVVTKVSFDMSDSTTTVTTVYPDSTTVVHLNSKGELVK